MNNISKYFNTHGSIQLSHLNIVPIHFATQFYLEPVLCGKAILTHSCLYYYRVQSQYALNIDLLNRIKIIYVLKRQTDKGSSLQLYSPNAHESQTCALSQGRVGNSICVSHVGGRYLTTSAIITTSPGLLKLGARTKHQTKTV